MKIEVWKPVTDYFGIYEVSNYGNVRSLKYKGKQRTLILKQLREARGYLHVVLVKNGVKTTHLIHRLVANAFPEICGEWFEGCVINHKDENPSNNCAWNLEVCTNSYNINYKNAMVRRTISKSKPINQLTLDGVVIQKWLNSVEAGKALGVNSRHIRDCCKNAYGRKTAGGFKWQYA